VSPRAVAGYLNVSRIETMSATLAAALSLVSAIVVAVLSHVFSTRRKRGEELAEFRLSAYTDFINSVSRLVSARRMGRVSDELEELAALNDAKTRICICGDQAVVEALGEFWLNGGTLEKESEILAFTRLCMRIREALGNKEKEVYTVNVSQVLFQLQPATY